MFPHALPHTNEMEMQEAEVMAGESPPAEVAMEKIPAAPIPPAFPTSIASDVRARNENLNNQLKIWKQTITLNASLVNTCFRAPEAWS